MSGFVVTVTWAILGPVGSASGALAIQIRDLDQTVIGNPAHERDPTGAFTGNGCAWIGSARRDHRQDA